MHPIGDLTPRRVTTPEGDIVLWSSPEPGPPRGERPVLLAIGGAFSAIEDLKNVPSVLSRTAEAYVMRVPGGGIPPLARPGVAPVAAAVGHILQTVFAGRPVVLLGISIGGVVALSARAPNLARVVAIDPPLVAEDLWPVVGPLRQLGAGDKGVRIMGDAYFGVTATGSERRDHLAALEGLACPADVVLGGEPLHPERPVTRFPSLVNDEARRRLAEAANVRLHLVKDAGHNVFGQATGKVQEVLLEALRRASAHTALEDRSVDEPLLDATPLSARRLLYAGPGGEAFRRACLRANSKATVELAPEGVAATPAGARFEAIVAAGPPASAELSAIAGRLQIGGHLIARWHAERTELAASLEPHGLFLREPIDAAQTGVLRAQRCAPGERPRPALHLHTIPYAATMMDIRTRLPARALASDPEFASIYEPPPAHLPGLPPDAPKVVVLQRCGELDLDWYVRAVAIAMRVGRLAILEFDDHPWLISEVMGLERSERQMLRFGYAHAVQTTVQPLVEAFRPYNPEVMAFPNAAFTLAPFQAGPRPRRVLYGAVLRGDYGVAVAQSLQPAIEAFPDTEFVVVGDPAVFEALPTTVKRYYDFMSFEAYLRLMETCAISLAPIAPLPMRETKSDAKFVDASRSGALTIASPTVYERTITHGHNGLIAREVADWAPLLAQALGDQTLRERLARRAWEEVRATRMFGDQIAARRDWYLDLWSRREALNAALIARMPGLREALAR